MFCVETGSFQKFKKAAQKEEDFQTLSLSITLSHSQHIPFTDNWDSYKFQYQMSNLKVKISRLIQNIIIIANVIFSCKNECIKDT